jgi:hypothetical protein
MAIDLRSRKISRPSLAISKAGATNKLLTKNDISCRIIAQACAIIELRETNEQHPNQIRRVLWQGRSKA